MNIRHITARQILDSRGNPTIEADVELEGGGWGRAAVPSGASTGAHEAHELRDGEKAYGGKGVLKAVHNVSQIILPALKGMSADNQISIDNRMIELDGTDNKSHLGANAILAVSLATAAAAAKQKGVLLYAHINDLAGNVPKSLPMPMMNILNGGKHASGSTDVQESMIIPVSATSYAQAIQMGAEVFHALGSLLHEKGYATTVGDEGGYAPNVAHGNAEALELILSAIAKAGYTAGQDICLALDVAASELYNNESYYFTTEQRTLKSNELIHWYHELIQKYPIASIEDGLAEDDWQGWQALQEKLGKKTQLVGDDLLVTNIERLKRAILEKSANAILIKPNQIGTLSETIQAILLAKEHGWRAIVSHRSGETEDTTITHIAIGTGAGQIKTGSLSRSERTAKHNELMRLESIDTSLVLDNPFKR